ncbi:hypothetical protein [Pseudoalteromonas ostreae]|uniref:hypothetical protein n=1 Tax=Pseudoalteromonas ostreae TaxID=2774154 RepID=UPI001B38857B|nr:hypothetical protein [Pseudoalteromonas ostreae]
MSERSYATKLSQSDPLGFYIKLIGLRTHEKELRQIDNIYYILTGIVVYKQLDHIARQQVMAEIRKVRRVNPRLHGALFEIPPQIVADKYKFKWSLSDVELKAHYESSNGVSSALSFIGLDMRTFVGSAPIIGGILLEISKSGMKAGGKAAFNSISNSKLTAELAGQAKVKTTAAAKLGMFAALVTVLASGVRTMALVDEEKALNELYLRGMIEPK